MLDRNGAGAGIQAVRLTSLTRLRLAFGVLAVVLLTPLALLQRAAHERIENQRRLRHEVVAERIFDELERELSLLLDRESARPSAAYDSASMPEGWAPFVIGYFRSGPQGPRVVAEDRLAAERKARLLAVLETWQSAGPAVVQTPPPATTLHQIPRVSPKSSPEVLKQLNRSDEQRQRQRLSDPSL